MTEEWKAIPGWEGFYEASNHGRVRSLPRQVPRVWRGKASMGRVRGCILSQSLRRGYANVSLYRDAQGTTVAVHHLVLLAFVGPRPDGSFGCHYDDDPTNNTPENLRWGTRSDNERDKVRNGNHHNSRKTQCVNGHEYTPGNTYYSSRRGRECRTCRRLRGIARRAAASNA